MEKETIKGYVVDIACLRKNPGEGIFSKSKEHPKKCALMGHCIESGYGIVNESRIHLLDPDATEKVIRVLNESKKERGIFLEIKRESKEGEMKTTSVKEIN